MKDRDFLTWIHHRLVNHHGENPRRDYMHKLRGVIASTPAEQESKHAALLPTDVGPVFVEGRELVLRKRRVGGKTRRT